MDSVDDWFRRAEEKRDGALQLIDKKKLAREAYNLTGESIEFALKGAIMKRERFNRWPERSSRPDLHTHDLKALIEIAGIDHAALSIDLRTNLRVICTWTRGHDYMGKRMARKAARDFVDAAFGENGVLEWLKGL